MRSRGRWAGLAAVAVLAGGLALPAAAEPEPVLDGRRVRVLTRTDDAAAQAHAADAAAGVSPLDCRPPRCTVIQFVYFPQVGVRSDIAFTASWTSPLSEIDLYVAEVDPVRGNLPVARCASHTGGTVERVFFPSGFLRRGSTYKVIAEYQRTLGDRVTARVQMPGPDEAPTTVPSTVDRVVPVNCAH